MYKVGDEVKVISAELDAECGKRRHHFEVGQVVTVVSKTDDNWLICRGDSFEQFLEFDEVELVEGGNRK